MTQTNIENSMILNTKIIASKKLEINSKILHFIFPTPSNLNKIPEFYPRRLLGQSLKNMVKVSKEELTKTPVFFSLADIETFDNIYLKRFENNETIPKEELEKYINNYQNSLNLVGNLLSNQVESLEFGKKFWNLRDFQKK